MRSFAPTLTLARLARSVAALGFGLLALGASASPDNPQNGRDYLTLEKAQPTEPGGRVEVTEFFWYSCPHCNALEPSLNEWVKKKGAQINFKRVPIAFRPSMEPQQKLFYALEATGNLDSLHHKVFQAIHLQRKPLNKEAEILDWVAAQGVDRKKFEDAYKSFGVQSKVRRANQLQKSYRVDGVPMIAVGGRYITAPHIVGQSIGNRPEPVLHAATFQVLDWLIARTAEARSQTGGASAPAAQGAAAAH